MELVAYIDRSDTAEPKFDLLDGLIAIKSGFSEIRSFVEGATRNAHDYLLKKSPENVASGIEDSGVFTLLPSSGTAADAATNVAVSQPWLEQDVQSERVFVALYKKDAFAAMDLLIALFSAGCISEGRATVVLSKLLGKERRRHMRSALLRLIATLGNADCALQSLMQDFNKYGGADRLDLASRVVLEFGVRALPALLRSIRASGDAAAYLINASLELGKTSPSSALAIERAFAANSSEFVRTEFNEALRHARENW